MVAREVLRGRNYRALARMARVYGEPGQAVRRYFAGRGDYPYRCPVRTPAGTFEVETDDLGRRPGVEMTRRSRAVECPRLRAVADRLRALLEHVDAGEIKTF